MQANLTKMTKTNLIDTKFLNELEIEHKKFARLLQAPTWHSLAAATADRTTTKKS